MSNDRYTTNGAPVFEMVLETSDGHDEAVSSALAQEASDGAWEIPQQDGQLAVDIVETKKDVVVISTMAGAETGRIEVFIHNDLLTIRGQRMSPVDEDILHRFYEECFWGTFSRSIVLPVDVKADLARAEFRNGLLVVRIPKRRADTRIPVTIIDE